MKSYQKNHELERRRLWANVWANTANAIDCKDPDTPTHWADKAIEAFDQRFKQFKESA